MVSSSNCCLDRRFHRVRAGVMDFGLVVILDAILLIRPEESQEGDLFADDWQ